jgi:hypothetical protein
LWACVRWVCAKEIKVSEIQAMKERSALLMCNLEKVLPPSFFLLANPFDLSFGGGSCYSWDNPCSLDVLDEEVYEGIEDMGLAASTA